jgi:hypothetical protein
MRRSITFVLVLGALGVAGSARANGGVSFIAERYYFDLSYGKVHHVADKGSTYEFYRETRLPGSTIWKVHFRSIHRIEFSSESAALDSLSSHAEKATVTWNPSRTRVLAAFGEYAFILNPSFHLQTVYGNTASAQWLNDDEIKAVVETGERSVYDTALFAIDVTKDQYRRIK